MPPPNLSPTTISKELTLDLPTTLQFLLYKIQIRFPLPSSVHMATGPTWPFELRGSLTPTEFFSPASALLRSRQLTGKPKHKPTGVFFLQNHNGPKSRSIGCQIHPKFPCSPAHYSSGRNGSSCSLLCLKGNFMHKGPRQGYYLWKLLPQPRFQIQHGPAWEMD